MISFYDKKEKETPHTQQNQTPTQNKKQAKPSSSRMKIVWLIELLCL